MPIGVSAPTTGKKRTEPFEPSIVRIGHPSPSFSNFLMAPMTGPLARNPTPGLETSLILGRSPIERVWYNVDLEASNLAV